MRARSKESTKYKKTKIDYSNVKKAQIFIWGGLA